MAFIFLIVIRDPGQIQDLPKIPEGFLYLMGISSFGYLGGKLARKPGPIIDEILAEKSSLKLTIKGRNLSKDAMFRIDSDDLTADLLGRNETSAGVEIIEKDAQSNEATYA